ncbi:DUF1524 domain-containing protein [Bdellovibrio sp. HCB337]|uniref:GmrSD restriction endonuclease domain-containing protein n=1 Tax=Bdellovibrio sp. HCB337 TaxID=3394358 RepID=UPI0039A51BAC
MQSSLSGTASILMALTALWVVIFTGSVGQAQATEPNLDSYAPTQLPIQEYYTVNEAQATFTAAPQSTDMSPLSMARIDELTQMARSLAVNLLSWTLHPEAPEMPDEKYQRQHHFGRWINDPTDETCYNTRAKVLIRDSEGPVSFKEKNHCLVEKGDWADPYAGDMITESKNIQIDHMVPLKHAYITGAWEWDYQTRCTYANFMGNNFHLITANGRENMRKGDRGPDQYLPPNQAYRCEYLKNWLKIKLIWQLKMTPTEISAIRRTFEENDCQLKDFSLSQRELKRQRKLIHANNDVCPIR